MRTITRRTKMTPTARRFHKYIEKIGDRYFYTMKDLQAYLNKRKSKFYSNVSNTAWKVAGKSYGRSFDKNIDGFMTGDEKAYIEGQFHGWVGQVAARLAWDTGKKAVRAWEKAEKANREKALRVLQREAETKMTDVEEYWKDSGNKFVDWLYKNGVLSEETTISVYDV